MERSPSMSADSYYESGGVGGGRSSARGSARQPSASGGRSSGPQSIGGDPEDYPSVSQSRQSGDPSNARGDPSHGHTEYSRGSSPGPGNTHPTSQGGAFGQPRSYGRGASRSHGHSVGVGSQSRGVFPGVPQGHSVSRGGTGAGITARDGTNRSSANSGLGSSAREYARGASRSGNRDTFNPALSGGAEDYIDEQEKSQASGAGSVRTGRPNRRAAGTAERYDPVGKSLCL